MELQFVGAPWVQGTAESNANSSDALAGVVSLTVRRCRSHFVLFLLFFPIAYGYCGLWSGRGNGSQSVAVFVASGNVGIGTLVHWIVLVENFSFHALQKES